MSYVPMSSRHITSNDTLQSGLVWQFSPRCGRFTAADGINVVKTGHPAKRLRSTKMPLLHKHLNCAAQPRRTCKLRHLIQLWLRWPDAVLAAGVSSVWPHADEVRI